MNPPVIRVIFPLELSSGPDITRTWSPTFFLALAFEVTRHEVTRKREMEMEIL